MKFCQGTLGYFGVLPDHKGGLQARGRRVGDSSGAQKTREINPLGVSVQPEVVSGGDF